MKHILLHISGSWPIRVRLLHPWADAHQNAKRNPDRNHETVPSNKTCILDSDQWAGVDTKGRVRHPPYSKKLFVRRVDVALHPLYVHWIALRNRCAMSREVMSWIHVSCGVSVDDWLIYRSLVTCLCNIWKSLLSREVMNWIHVSCGVSVDV